jgi:Putative motility protein
MNIASSTGVQAAMASGSAGSAAQVLVLKKALDQQSAGAAALIAALPQAPGLAQSGALGRNVNTYA